MGMLQLFSDDIYVMLDPDSALSYMTPYLAMNFNFVPKNIFKPFLVSTLVGESIIARRVY